MSQQVLDGKLLVKSQIRANLNFDILRQETRQIEWISA